MSKKIEITCSGSKSLPIDELKDFQGNLKTLPKTELEKLKRSIVNHGFSFPVFVWRKNILDGHQRLFATKELLKEGCTINDIPVVEIQAKNKKHAAQKLLLLNSRFADFTEDGISAFIKEFEFELPDIEDISLPDFEIEDFFGNDGDEERLTDPDDIPEAPEEPITKTGDLWILGNHRLLCGDSTSEADVKRLMDGELADMIFCDPPYGVSYADKNAMLNAISKGNSIQTEIENDHKSKSEMKEFWTILFRSMNKSSSNRASYYLTGPQGGELMMMMSIIDAGWQLKHMLIWVKNNHVLGRSDYHYKHEPILYGWKEKGTHKFYGGSRQFSIWEINKPQKSELHPTMKPVELVTKCIENSSTNNNIIIDFCLGSGTTLIACEKTNRKCYGIEIDPKYCDVIVKRWEDYTGKKAQLVNANDPN